MKRYKIEDMHAIAKSRGGRCLSEEYINGDIKLKWQCKNKHVWLCRPRKILEGCWCSKCHFNKSKLTISEMKELAEKKHGRCLSSMYIGNRSKLKWQCKDRHIWWAEPGNIKTGTWCPKCGGKRKPTQKDLINLAKIKDGKCLSRVYNSVKSKMKWRCNKGHIWRATYNNIQQGKWCPKCATIERNINRTGITATLNIEKIRLMVKEKDGQCLSDKYLNGHTKMKWRCKEGHEWEAVSSHIVNDNVWCPECSSYKSEKLCREYLNKKFSEKFIKSKPKFLNGLELDCYSKKYKLAIEYNGRQHYEHVEYFHTKQEFINQIKRDKIKKKLCRKNGIKLIIIPYTYNATNPNKLYNYIDSHIQ